MNKLAQSTSPYLLQHANNPVNWCPWGKEALEKAKIENKLLLISIGYSACHWCHVMEHESFEDEQVANVMNRYFVCIKIDREERPDIDQIYMNAVQLMTGRGGWPLNCICLPDQRPIYGGTYFPKNDWKQLLLNLANFYETKPEEAIDYAVRLTEGIHSSEKIFLNENDGFYTLDDIEKILSPWKKSFDYTDGGHKRAPKFPMPNNWQFLLKAAFLLKDKSLEIIVGLTLEKMAGGGIYDHLAGGFARYSVDGKWHVPHFEKMLYDNAQLISLYAEAYRYSQNKRFKEVIYETLHWIETEMTTHEGAFLSALDADSEGVEGKFYTWTKYEIDEILGDDASIFNTYYGITDSGNWEEENINILMVSNISVSEEFNISDEKVKYIISNAKEKLYQHRKKRIHPGVDDKILTSWNALQLKALTDAFKTFADEKFLQIALKNAKFLLANLIKEDGGLYRTYKNGKASINGFLDDYALTIEAFIALYEITFDEEWLIKANKLCQYVLDNFSDDETQLFFYTGKTDEPLISRKHEIMDNVIPASNSVMAWNLKKLSLYFDIQSYEKRYQQMLKNIHPEIYKYGSAYSNWASLLLEEVIGTYEIAITGEDFYELKSTLEKNYIPNKIMLGGKKGTLPLLQNKFTERSTIFVCKNKTCSLPVYSVQEATKQINP